MNPNIFYSLLYKNYLLAYLARVSGLGHPFTEAWSLRSLCACCFIPPNRNSFICDGVMASNLAASDGAIGGCPEAAAPTRGVGVVRKLKRSLRSSRPGAWWGTDGARWMRLNEVQTVIALVGMKIKVLSYCKWCPKTTTEHLRIIRCMPNVEKRTILQSNTASLY